jgi:TetR/AcrR family transcriptional regulator, mexJK operon transcriptional repressor
MARPPGTLDLRKHAAILAAASNAFLAEGYGVSVDQIAAAAGVSKQTVYSHFGSKGELLRALVTDRVQAITAPLADLPPEAALEQTLQTFGTGFLAAILSPRAIGLYRLVIAQAVEFPELARIFYEAGPRTNAGRLAAYLAREAAKGTLAVADPMLAAELLIGLLLSHVQIRAMLGVAMLSPDERERRVAQCVSIFLTAHERR